MNPAIIIPCGDLCRRDGANRGHTGTVPCAAARATDSHRERYGAICHGPLVSVLRTVSAIIMNAVFTTVPDANPKSVRKNLRQPFGAGNRIPGSTRVERLQQPSHVRCPFTHVDNPFRVALASEKQSARKGKQGVGERPQELVKQGQGDE